MSMFLNVLRLVGSAKAAEQGAVGQQQAARRKGRAPQAVAQPEEREHGQQESDESSEDISVDFDSSGSDEGSDAEQQSDGGSEDASGSEQESSSLEDEEEQQRSGSDSDSGTDSKASPPPACRARSKRGRAARQRAAKPAGRRSSRSALQPPAAEESESAEEEEEEEQPSKCRATTRQQPQRREGWQPQTRSAAADMASEASGAAGRRAASRQPASSSQLTAPSRLGRGSSRQQQQAQPDQELQQRQQQEQEPSVLSQWVAAGKPPSSGSLSHMTVTQLQAECGNLGLQEDGKKPDLVCRLLEWWEQQAERQLSAAPAQRAQQQAQKQQWQQRPGSAVAGKHKGRVTAAAEVEVEIGQQSEQPAAKRAQRGGQPSAEAQQPALVRQLRHLQHQQQATAQAEAQRHAAEEDEKEEQRGRKRRSARKASGKRQAAAPEVEQSPELRARRGSPAPAAAAQQLEMSLPPEAAGAAGRPAAAAAAAAAARGSDVEMADAAVQTGGAAAATLGHSDPAAVAAGYLRHRLTKPRSSEAGTMTLRPRLQEVHRSLLDSLDATVELGHNTSLLIVGPRGSGKTLVAERALADLAAKYNSNPKDPVVGVIRLSGQVHSEERVAFRELARQLCEAFGYQFSKAASVGENIEFLRGMLARLRSCDKVALFLLDDFDGFAGKRAKQTLLYNLLDALQTSGMQAAVVGVSCRQDVVEMLEKRVKSRFSHRKLDVSLPTSALPTAPQPTDESTIGLTRESEAQDGALDVLQAMLTLPPNFVHQEFAAQWNASVAVAAGSTEVKQALQRCINVFPSLRHLANVADWALSAAASSGTLTAAVLLGALQRQMSQAKGMVTMISGLPVLDLILLVALQRLAQRGKEDVNFEMAHHEFSKYSLVGAHVDSYTRGAAAKAYDHLLSLGLLAFVDPRSEARVGSRQYAPAYLLVTREEVSEGLAEHYNCPQSLSEWLKKEGGLGTTAGHFLA